jgi:hypothetical protein
MGVVLFLPNKPGHLFQGRFNRKWAQRPLKDEKKVKVPNKSLQRMAKTPPLISVVS